MKYRPDIDGLRAVAILTVLFYHFELGFSGGYVGVDVFFVISGYLITGLILKDLDRDRFSIVEFWERRVRRILPALALVVATTLAAGWFLLIPTRYKELAESTIAQSLLVSNIYFWKKSGYFAPDMHLQPLLHTWSLAVEEQFYLIFPFLLIGVRRISRKSLVPIMLLLCGGSFALSVYCSYRHTLANFYFLPTRAWELLLGALLCAMPAKPIKTRWMTECAGWLGLGAILVASFVYTEQTRFPGVTALLPCIGAALIIGASNDGTTTIGGFLASRSMVFIGLISYSLYLWHWPLLVFARHVAIDPLLLNQRIILMLTSVVLAAVSWRFVETPFRKRTVLTSRPRIFAFAGITAAVLLLAGLSIQKMDGLPSRMPPQALRYAAGSRDKAMQIEVNLKQARQGDFVELGAGDKARPVELVVWGDSHAMATLPVLDLMCRERTIRGVAAVHASHIPFVGYESRSEYSLKNDGIPFNDATIEFIRQNHVHDVLLIAHWNVYVEIDRETDRLRHGLLATIDALKNSNVRIWIMKPVPAHRWDVPSALASAIIFGRDIESLGRPLVEHRDEMRPTEPVFAGISSPNVVFFDPTDLFTTPAGRCRVAADGNALYRDDHHLSTHGAMRLRPMFEPIFEKISGSRNQNKIDGTNAPAGSL